MANALRHVGDDVVVTVGPLPDGDGFYVEDDGEGIEPGRRAEVFEAGVTTDDDGTGFGLKIVSEIADAHGWRVDVTDGEDGGARFRFHDVGGIRIGDDDGSDDDGSDDDGSDDD